MKAAFRIAVVDPQHPRLHPRRAAGEMARLPVDSPLKSGLADEFIRVLPKKEFRRNAAVFTEFSTLEMFVYRTFEKYEKCLFRIPVRSRQFRP